MIDNTLIGPLTAGIAHEYNNILSIITGYVHILSQSHRNDADLQQKLTAIQHATFRAETLNTALLTLNAQPTTSCNLISTINDALPLIRAVLGSRTDLRVCLPVDDIIIKADSRSVTEALLTQITLHKNSSTSLTLTVTTERDQASLCIGQNATLVYPRVETDNPFINKTVLIVDDEEALLPVLEHQLQDMGMKVLKAANADTALLLQKDYPDVIDFLLTDIVMPDVDGIELAHRISDDRPRMGVVYMTGYSLTADIPDDSLIIPKPLRPETLSDAFRKALEKVQDA